MREPYAACCSSVHTSAFSRKEAEKIIRERWKTEYYRRRSFYPFSSVDNTAVMKTELSRSGTF